MRRQFSVTYGSESLLTHLIDVYSKRHMVLFTRGSDEDDLQLVDLSDRRSVFVSPFTYRVLAQQGDLDEQDYFAYCFFTLDVDQAKVFTAKLGRRLKQALPIGMTAMLLMQKKKPVTDYVVLTTWVDEDDYERWRKSTGFDLLREYATTNNQFHSAIYHVPIEEDDDEAAEDEITETTENDAESESSDQSEPDHSN
ncbi:hypothetical protein ACFQET_09855 [Levilactobacillus tangyuanensis]|uniref:ABM domain-containing protein n=1 Tax=Levilactobacillus tangyuanensis TaxID=2486021 RepID=A0ABW1TRE8_9LACO|nr:hypothetical protein [Levilactobacillus tangyuanensis]